MNTPSLAPGKRHRALADPDSRRALVLAAWLVATTGWSLAADTTRPSLTSVQPPNPSTGVVVTQVVRFVFSEPMATSPSLLDVSFTALQPLGGRLSNWRPSWSGDERTLACIPSTPWPAGTLITWRLGTNLVDRYGNPLVDAYMGSFQTRGSQSQPGSTNDLTVLLVTRSHHYRQASAASPELEPQAPYRFESVALMASNRAPTAVFLGLPIAGQIEMAADWVEPDLYRFEETSNDAAAFGARFPAGPYAFAVEEGTGVLTAELFLLPNQPPVPHLENFAEAQAAAADQPFTLRWAPFAGGTSADSIRVQIAGTDVGSPPPGQPGALDGAATSWTLPAGTLTPGHQYTGQLEFIRSSQTTNLLAFYRGTANRSTVTQFPVTAVAGGPVTPPVLLVLPPSVPSLAHIRVTGDPGQQVSLEASPSLAFPSWTVVTQISLPVSGEFPVELNLGQSGSAFYRGRTP